MGQTTSTSMCPPEERMKKRIRQTMGTFSDFGIHIKQANEWAKLCPTPKTCYLSFRMVINDCISLELLPYVWKLKRNVYVEVRKLRRRPDHTALNPLSGTTWQSAQRRDLPFWDGSDEVIGHSKVLTVRQFYYIYCFLNDIKACAAHTVQFPENSEDPEFDETECQICMDKKKQVVLPCTHSFCLHCFKNWSAQKCTCPICRSNIECSEGSDLWQLTHQEIRDIGSYATDLVARIFEFLEKRDRSLFDEETIERSAEIFAAADTLKSAPLRKVIQAELIPTRLPIGLASFLGRVSGPSEVDADFLLALELSAGEDQFAAFRQFEQMRQDQVLAMTIAMQVDDEDDGTSRSGGM